MKKVSALKARTEEGGVSVAMHNTKSKNNIVSPLYIEGSTALKTEAPLEPDQLPLSIEQILPAELNIKSGVGTFFKAIHVRHWTKNLLVFMPLLLSSTPATSSLLFSAALAFLCLSLCASSVYVLNALMDLDWDLPILTGVWSVSLLLLASVVLSLFLPSGFLLVLAAYSVLTLAYTLYLEQNMLAGRCCWH